MTKRRSGPRILLVGAGAVGQTYGFHLQRGGAEVSFLVRPQYADAARAGFPVHCHNGRYRGAHLFTDFGVLTTPEEVAARAWDQIWLCVSSPALRGPWLQPLLMAAGDATVVTLQPGLSDRNHLLEWVDEARLVSGLISFLSYPTPLPGGPLPPGMAWWFPPLSPSPFSGPKGAVSSVVRALERGGCPAKSAQRVYETVAFASGLMMPTIAALEVADWSFRRLLQPAYRRLATRGGRQASGIGRPGHRRWLAWLVTSGLVLNIAARLAPWVVPFDLQTYLRVHFSKVGDQTRAMLHHYRTLAKDTGQPDDALATLLERLD